MSDEMMSEMIMRRVDRSLRYDYTLSPMGLITTRTYCKDCGAYVQSERVHDKFHDAYKPSRKATFAVAHQDGHVEIQLIDGSKIVMNANEDGTPALDEEAAQHVMNSMNKALAPYYEGGETAIIEANAVE